MIGRIQSIQSLGTLDGPGVRFVAFMAGCPLRCKCCHNPETIDGKDFGKYEPEKLADTAARFLEYFGERGGVTLSGGEPLLQAEFATEYFRLCHERGINTCLDTSGITFSREPKMLEKFNTLLGVTDLVMLDIKHTDDRGHVQLCGKEGTAPRDLLRYLSEIGKPTRIRYVLVPGYTDGEDDLLRLGEIVRSVASLESLEILPYHELGKVKYEALGMPYKLEGVRVPSAEDIARAKDIINKNAPQA